MAEGLPDDKTGTREMHPGFSRDKFESSPEFAIFKRGMRKLLKVSKAELDEAVRMAKIESPRRGDPMAPGRKPKAGR
jgi:hypothetical protein